MNALTYKHTLEADSIFARPDGGIIGCCCCCPCCCCCCCCCHFFQLGNCFAIQGGQEKHISNYRFLGRGGEGALLQSAGKCLSGYPAGCAIASAAAGGGGCCRRACRFFKQLSLQCFISICIGSQKLFFLFSIKHSDSLMKVVPGTLTRSLV
jgi:hypothetical protein